MSVFLEKSKQIKRIDVNKILRGILKDKAVKKFVLDLNRKDQLFLKGEQSDGNFLESSNSTPGVYSFATIEIIKAERGSASFTFDGLTKEKKEGERYTLYDSGEWYRSFKLLVGNTEFELQASTTIGNSNTNVFEEYGKNVVGLSGDSIIKLTKYLKGVFIIQVKKEATK
jgi:hypothetical protein